MIKIIADEALPNAAEVFSAFGEVKLMPGRVIKASDLKDVTALIIRSVTKVNADLLSQANALKFIGSATAGFDHVDTDLLRQRGIAFTNAPGSNSISVGDYVLSVLLVLSQRYEMELAGCSIGIVGCGYTGSQVLRKAHALGMFPIVRDPPLARNGLSEYGASFDEILDCDFISLHVPLIKEGADATYHLFGEKELKRLRPGAFLINAARGSVVDNQALYKCLKSGQNLHAWCDVFEGEPDISVRELLPLLEGATAHIAGYSFESKRRAALMLAQELARVLKLPLQPHYEMPPVEIQEMVLGAGAKQLDLDLLSRLVFSVYDVRRDCYEFSAFCKDGASFDFLRKRYRERRELSSLTVSSVPSSFIPVLKTLGFSCKN